MMSKEYEKVMELLQCSKRGFALTGAGVSTLSGIPDFRTDDSGIWDRFDRDRIFNISVFYRHPELFYEFAREQIYGLHNAKPSEAHLLLAELEKRGMINAVATQNIDGLHHEAGSETVYELHGHARSSHCIDCGRYYSIEETVERLKDVEYPLCDCGSPIKPDVIFYGEQLPVDALNRSMSLAQKCDLLLVMGTSLVVYPVAFIPQLAKESGASIIIFNKTETPFDSQADVVIRDDLKEASNDLMGRLKSSDCNQE